MFAYNKQFETSNRLAKQRTKQIRKFARIVSVNGVTKDLPRMLKVMSMATRDLKLGIGKRGLVRRWENFSFLRSNGNGPWMWNVP